MLELTITSSYVDIRVDSNTFTMGNPMPESALTLYTRVDFIPQSGPYDLVSAPPSGKRQMQLLTSSLCILPIEIDTLE